jgi:hypothetical protein
MSIVIFIIVIFAIIIAYLYAVHSPVVSLSAPVQIQGVRLNTSLEEIFKIIIPSGKIQITAILDANKKMLWSPSMQLELNSDYNVMSEYILIEVQGSESKIDSLSLYETEVSQRFQYLLQRPNVFIGLTDASGNSVGSFATSTGKISVIIISFFVVAAAAVAIFAKRR